MASRVADILMQEGLNAARAREASGAIWGGALANVARLPEEAMAQHRADVLRQEQEQTRQLQQREMQQNLALGDERLRAIEQDKMDEALTAQLVQANSKLDPDTGHLVTDHQAVTAGLTGKGRMKASERYTDFAAKNEEAINSIQNAHLAVEQKKSRWRADTLGAIVDAPDAQQPGMYATVRGTLTPLAQQDPILGKLPPTYPGKDQLRAIYESQLSDAERFARHTKAAEDRLKRFKEVPNVGLVDVGDVGEQPKVVVGTAPPKHYEQKSVLLDGKPAEVHFDPSTGKHYDASGTDVSARIKPIPPQAAVTVQQAESDAKVIADAIVRGEQPPDIRGLYRNAGPVRAQLAKQGYDLTTANLDWQAAQKHIATLNSAQQTRLRQNIATASESLDVIDNLAKQWDAGRFPLLNKANLIAAKNGAYGKDAASLATQLDGQITDVTSELGNVYMGGNSPTDHALQLAGKNLSTNWDKKVLLDMTALARTNLRIRTNSMLNVGVAGLSAAPTVATPAAPVEEWVRDANGKLVKKPQED